MYNSKLKYKNGIHAMKDAAVTRKTVLENLASRFCRRLLRVRFRFSLQIKRYEKHAMSNGVIKQIITMMSIFRGIIIYLFIYLFIYYILLGRILQLPRGKGHKRTSRSYSKVPHLTHPPIRIRKTATAPGSPYSFRIVRGFFYVPQNYQHSRNCETGPPTYRPYPRRLESLTICR